jgi:hypothetical protein
VFAWGLAELESGVWTGPGQGRRDTRFKLREDEVVMGAWGNLPQSCVMLLRYDKVGSVSAALLTRYLV